MYGPASPTSRTGVWCKYSVCKALFVQCLTKALCTQVETKVRASLGIQTMIRNAQMPLPEEVISMAQATNLHIVVIVEVVHTTHLSSL